MEVYYFPVYDMQQHVDRLDVRNHIEKILPTSQPKVSQLVSGTEAGLQSTTVALRLEKTEHSRRNALQKLMDAPLIDTHHEISQLRVPDNWHGITVLAETSKDPSFEYAIPSMVIQESGLVDHFKYNFCSWLRRSPIQDILSTEKL